MIKSVEVILEKWCVIASVEDDCDSVEWVCEAAILCTVCVQRVPARVTMCGDFIGGASGNAADPDSERSWLLLRPQCVNDLISRFTARSASICRSAHKPHLPSDLR